MQVENIPTLLADFWDISTEAAQAILSIVVIMAVLLPTMYFAKGTRAVAIEIVLVILTEAVLVGIGWLPFWLLIATVASIAIAVAALGADAVVGGR